MRNSKLVRRRVNLALFIMLILPFSLTVQAQECSVLISKGIYDISSSASDLKTAASFASWFCDQKFSSSNSADSFGASLGFPFEGVPVKFGFDSGSQSFSSWYSSFCSKVQQDQSLQSKVSNYVQTINPTVVMAFNDCINADGLSVWLERTDDPHVFKFAARFTSPNPQKIPVARFSSFERGDNVNCAGRPGIVSRSTFRTRCTRANDAAVTMVVNADFDPRGGGTLTLPPIQQLRDSTPAADLRGAYVCQAHCPAGGGVGAVAFVESQDGKIILVNEGGNQSRGVVTVDGKLIALDWEGGLQATLEGSDIHWSNGTIWHRVTLRNLSGSYTCHVFCPAGGEGGVATVTPQGEGNLLFVNEGGGKSGGNFKYPNTVVADEWGLRGVVAGNEIRWSDKTIWRRVAK